MLRAIVLIVVAAICVMWVLDSNREADAQNARDMEQGRLLAQLEGLHSPGASQLVDEWRNAYPAPSDSKLTELRVMVDRVVADPSSVAKYTVAEKQHEIDASPFRSATEVAFGTRRTTTGIDN